MIGERDDSDLVKIVRHALLYPLSSALKGQHLCGALELKTKKK